ncbi:MAG: response regulator, partial [Leptolyngbya sp. SIO1D8]|nr:response regulator [Leptolyngbya sp. SIO1D8]
ALEHHPEQVVSIAHLALQDFQAGQAAVLAGDRTQGGYPSEALQVFAESQVANQVTAVSPGNAAAEVEDVTVVEAKAVITPETAIEKGFADTSVEAKAAVPGIQKLFRWMRESVQPASGQIDETPDDLSALAEIAVDPTPEIDATSDPFLEQADDSDADALLENIWGAPPSSTDTDVDTGLDIDAAPLAITSNPVNPNTEAEPTHEAEVLRLTDLSNSLRSRPSVQSSNPLPSKGGVSSTPTVRVQIEHLDQLNYAVGELLTNHNQQSLQAEKVQMAMRHLYARLQQHQQLLNQLQDWIDSPQMLQEDPQLESWANSPSLRLTDVESNPPAQSADTLPIGFDALELDQYSKPQLILQSLLDDTVQLTEATDAVELFVRQSRQTQEKQGRLLLETRDALIESRMLPLGQLFERFPAVLQQLETLHHKPVELTLQGTEVLVDKAIAERLYDPLLHLVRNAFDHGIEPADMRQQWAKPRAGQLKISAYHQGKHLIIEVQDDGQGLNFERIRQRAIDRQLLSPQQAHQLSPAQLTDLLFEPGFSTASQVSSLSGRGVGLDVVRNQLQALQGEVAVTSVAQAGTTFTLRIPLSLTIAKLLLCQAEGRTYALLPDAIEQIVIPQTNQIQQREHCKALWWGRDEEACWVPVYGLSALLDYPDQTQSLPTPSPSASLSRTSTPHILLIRRQGVLLGLEVDQMLDEQELVIRPLNPLLATHSYIDGASILADGRLTLVLDGVALAEAASNLQTNSLRANATVAMSAHTQATPTHSQGLPINPDLETGVKIGRKLLVVDDSITTRQTLTLTLQKSGYQVIQAQDGQEAVKQLLQHPNVQLVICDIEMPRMNGFEFLQHCQHDSELAQVPVMMLSSRSSDKHRLLAEQLGAIAYLSKPYLEHKLLEMIAEALKVNALNATSR